MPWITDGLNGNYLDIDTFSDADLEERVDVSIIEIPNSYASPEAYLAEYGLNLPNKITGSLSFERKDGTVVFVSKKDINWKQVHRLMLKKVIASKLKSNSVDTARSTVHDKVMGSDEVSRESGV